MTLIGGSGVRIHGPSIDLKRVYSSLAPRGTDGLYLQLCSILLVATYYTWRFSRGLASIERSLYNVRSISVYTNMAINNLQKYYGNVWKIKLKIEKSIMSNLLFQERCLVQFRALMLAADSSKALPQQQQRSTQTSAECWLLAKRRKLAPPQRVTPKASEARRDQLLLHVKLAVKV